MVVVTECAKEELGKILESSNVEKRDVALRLTVGANPEQIALVLSPEMEGDEVTQLNGKKVLLVGEDIADALKELTLDCRETSKGRHLIVSWK